MLSLHDNIITTTVDPFTSNPSYVPSITNNNDFDCIYMDINDSYKNILLPTINIDENPAYGKLDFDDI